MEVGRDNLESQLQRYIKDAEKEYQELEEQRNDINRRMENLKASIENLQRTLQFHLAKVGKVPQTEEPRFKGKTARQAYRVVLQEKKRASKSELIEAMKEGGFQFGDKAPLRVLQFATIGDKHVRRIGNDLYEWQEETEKDEDVTLPGFSS